MIERKEDMLIIFQDQMFEDVKWKTDKNLPQVPFISSLVESRLLISAVICNDMKLLTNLKVTTNWKYNQNC